MVKYYIMIAFLLGIFIGYTTQKWMSSSNNTIVSEPERNIEHMVEELSYRAYSDYEQNRDSLATEIKSTIEMIDSIISKTQVPHDRKMELYRLRDKTHRSMTMNNLQINLGQ